MKNVREFCITLRKILSRLDPLPIIRSMIHYEMRGFESFASVLTALHEKVRKFRVVSVRIFLSERIA